MREKLLEICKLHQIELLEHVPLSEHTSFRIGGETDFWAEISSADGLAALLRLCREEHFPYFVLGKGSNVLVTDKGYRGIIIHLNLSDVQHKGEALICGAGVSLAKAAKCAEELSLSGMEGLSGIPGSIGGALYMNAGAYGYEMAQIVSSCEYMDKTGEIHTLTAAQMDLRYRHSWFSEHPGVILSVTLELHPGDRKEISEKMQDFLKRRNDKQPLNYPSAGSTFKRPEGSYASKLIDECGLKGYTVGGAQVSEKHAGFVINKSNASCSDVLQLCSDVRRIVEVQTGFQLELEPVLLGEM